MKKVLAVLCLCMVGCASEPLYRINCGASEDYVDQAGNTWLADQEMTKDAAWGCVGGMTVARSPEEIPGTDAPDVYLNECYSMDAYKFKLPPGTYTARLHFAETFSGVTAAGERVFDVSVNGKVVLKDFDPFKEAGGAFKPAVKELKGLEPKDGKLVIGFTANIQNPEINGIEIIPE